VTYLVLLDLWVTVDVGETFKQQSLVAVLASALKDAVETLLGSVGVL
jgi:hypothetical protein